MNANSQEDYRIRLPAYAGPLDLLLLLVKRHEIDLHDIPVAELTEQYMQHLKLIEQIDVDLAGEFLVVAATLLEIKSQMLIPRGDPAEAQLDDEGYNQLDPRYELIQQLLAYKRYKDAAMQLDSRRTQWQQRFARVPPKHRPPGQEDDAEQVEIDLDDASALDLCEAFSRILTSIGQGPAGHAVVYDDTPLALHAEDIVDRLTREGEMTLQDLFVGRKSRGEMIGLFLATLELVRQKQVQVRQDPGGGQITLCLIADGERQQGDEAAADWRDPETGERQYDWPSEKDRLRAERRAKLRAQRLAKGQFSESDEDLDDVDEGDGDSNEDTSDDGSTAQ